MNDLIKRFLNLKNWEKLNNLQLTALEKGILVKDTNFMIIAPTASGKTGVAEIDILHQLEKKGKVIYAVPSHALIDDKLLDFEYSIEILQ